ncbi:Hok/Gef family protein [Escherichia coli]|nr:Hok/Gef family protein [Escherichia coli]
MICITILTFTLLTRQTLYELRFRDGDKEVAALMACTSRLVQAFSLNILQERLRGIMRRSVLSFQK